jgi:ubiquinone/menaquinone biosynthesis C-methylase UbiE
LKKREDFFKAYLERTPVAMAFWRSFECTAFQGEKVKAPVLDVGCGDGFFAKIAFGRKLDVGIDLDAGEVARAVKSGSYGRAVQASVTELPFPDKSFKTVISNCVLEHVPKIDRGLREISRVLKPGGRLIITVPSECFSTRSSFQSWFRLMGLEVLSQSYIDGLNKVFKHYHVDDAKTWGGRFKKAGFKMEKAEYFMPLESFHTYEKWLLPAFPAKICKVLFGRWVITPRFWVKWLVPPLVRRSLEREGGKGAGYLLIARKG